MGTEALAHCAANPSPHTWKKKSVYIQKHGTWQMLKHKQRGILRAGQMGVSLSSRLRSFCKFGITLKLKINQFKKPLNSA